MIFSNYVKNCYPKYLFSSSSSYPILPGLHERVLDETDTTFVFANRDNIKKGKLPVESLSRREGLGVDGQLFHIKLL